MTTIRHPSAPPARLLLEARENAHAPLGGLAPLRWSTEGNIPFMDDAGIDLAVVLLEEDEFITKEAQPAIKAALSGKPNVEIIYIPGANHAFARHTGTHYNAPATAKANGRMWDFPSGRLKMIPR
jgi:dienelactone hydrolase